jgi:acyl-CoA hydrolase
MEQTGKRVSDSKTEQVQLVRPQHLNGMGRLFGGQLVEWIDEVAGVVARRHCGTEITTAAIDHLRFREPVFQNDTVVLLGKVTYTGGTSLEVRVDSFVEDFDGNRRLINTAFLIEVALGEDGKPTPAPPLIVENEFEQAEFNAAQRRREFRRQVQSMP